MRRLLLYTREDAWRWLLGGAMLLLTNFAAMAVPQIFARAIDSLHHQAPVHHLQMLAGLLSLTAVAGALTRTCSRVLILNAARDIELKLRNAMYSRLIALDHAFYEEHALGDLMSRATNDLTQIRLMLGPAALNLVNTVVAYCVALPLMARISLPLTLAAFVVYPPAMLLLRHLGRVLYRANRRQQAALGRLSSVVQENLAASALVRAYAIEEEQNERFGQVNDDYLRQNLALSWVRSGMFRLSASLASAGMLIVVAGGGRQVMREQLSLGEVVALLEYMALLSGPTFALGWVLSLWQRGLASMARIEEIFDARSNIKSGALAPRASFKALRLDHVAVDFGHRRGLSDVTLDIPAGTTTGLIGAIGSGKSTLLRALVRLVPIEAGAMYLDDVSMQDLDTEQLRRLFAYVPQSPTLLNKSLRDNIAFGRPDASDEDILRVLDVVDFTADLARLPEGLDTPVGERGVTLSGGQKQRCALARALLLERPILLIDDVLSAVDSETERRVLTALRRERRGTTTLIAAHRTSCVEDAEQIVVLLDGRVAALGTHQQLIAQGGFYSELVARQHKGAQQQQTARAPAETLS